MLESPVCEINCERPQGRDEMRGAEPQSHRARMS